MIARDRRPDRSRGAALVEAAIVLPVVLSLLLGTIVAATGVLANVQVAMLAREGARYAAVHGGQYSSETGAAASTPASVYQNGILPMAAALQPSAFTYSVTWDDPSGSQMPTYYNASTGKYVTNNVRVTLTYAWTPAIIVPATRFQSTSVMPVSY